MSKGIVICNLWKREGKPSVNANKLGKYKSGDEVEILDVVLGETENDYYEGTPTWYKTPGNIYIWSGGVSLDLEDEFFERKIHLDNSHRTELDNPVSVSLNDDELLDTESSLPHYFNFYNIPKLWKKSKGKGVDVAILDTGVDLNHPNLVERFSSQWNFLDNSSDVDDYSGHGTHCAGIIASNGQNEAYGISPKVSLHIGKITNSEYDGIDGEVLSEAIKYYKGKVDFISISGGIPEKYENLQSEVEDALNHDTVIIAAIGNTNVHRVIGDYPAEYPGVFAVGALEVMENGMERLLSSTIKSSNIDIVAPGYEIYSTYKNSGYHKMSGTSMSTPFVVGVLSLLKDINSDSSNIDILNEFKTLRRRNSESDFNYHTIDPKKI